MGSIQNTIYYCCVSRGNRILYVYSGGDEDSFHMWYFETMGKRTYGFLIEDGYIYFTIVDESLGNLGVLQFLEHLRDEFKKVARKGSRGNFLLFAKIGLRQWRVVEEGKDCR
ncbi:hypothetical protein PRUPE_8G086200 [Prunus persica]|uniref:Uncharacterized protein n=1 Tax=Prunus persica TaxID=3760 RepID=M5VWI0_PRUPE|nr:hypothetical protein PRUPE_8G086200 [Prunus persica]